MAVNLFLSVEYYPFEYTRSGAGRARFPTENWFDEKIICNGENAVYLIADNFGTVCGIEFRLESNPHLVYG